MTTLVRKISVSWEWLSVVVGLVCALAVVWFLVSWILPDSKCEGGGNFCPIELERLEVQPDPVVRGQPAWIYDGLCNRSDEEVPITVELFLESTQVALHPAEPPIEVLDRMLVIDPNTCEIDPSRPIELEAVPETIPLGRWRLAARITARSPDGGFQIETETSQYFDVVEE